MAPNVADIIKLLEVIAPPHLAESWDNCGLQVGHRQWPVRHVRTALDPLGPVVADALDDGVELLVTHHPLIFKPMTQVDFGTEQGEIIRRAAEGCMAIYAAHTSLDKSPGGLNDLLAGIIGIDETGPLVPDAGEETYKLAVFVPMDHVQAVIDQMAAAGAGCMGNYSGCTFRTEGRGTFIPGPGADPYTGTSGQMNQVAEARLETLVAAGDLEKVIAAVQAVHPYECMAYDVYPVVSRELQGLGRVGRLEVELDLGAFVDHLCQKMGLTGGIRMVGDQNRKVQKVALCTGSGSSLTRNFISSGADVYVSGDIHYHDARLIEAAGLALVDIGHFASERIMVEGLADLLRQQLDAAGHDVDISTCRTEQDPFAYR